MIDEPTGEFDMQLKEIMTKEVELLDSEATVKEAAQAMKRRNIGALPLRKDDRLVGMLTDRDIVVRALADGLDISKVKVSQIMTSPIAYCFEDQSIEDAGKIMEEKQIRRLPVLNRQKRLVGFVSLADVAVQGRDDLLSGKVLEAVSLASVH
jgi:CBS domain-containing protein